MPDRPPPRFHEDECDVDGCPEPVVTIIRDLIKVRGGENRREVIGLCKEHKREPETRHEVADHLEEEMPF